MFSLPFDTGNLRSCFRHRDQLRDHGIADTSHRDKLALDAAERVRKGIAFADGFRITSVRGKTAYALRNPQQELVARLIGRNLRGAFGLRYLDRDLIVQHLLSIFEETASFSICRYDIQSFYESVDRHELFAFIKSTSKCSWETQAQLKDFFAALDSQGIKGIPRGVGLSADLAEITLRKMDTAVRSFPEVFYYARFVDDMIVIGSNDLNKDRLRTTIKGALPSPLEIHTAAGKFSELKIEKANKGSAKQNSVDFLGYRFWLTNEKSSSKKVFGTQLRHVQVDIAPAKIEKLKRRVTHSFLAYVASSQAAADFDLLRMRMKALAGNYVIDDPITGIKIKTGIYFNYKLKTSPHVDSLLLLDRHVRHILFSPHSRLAKRVQSKLNMANRRQLGELSFGAAFEQQRIFHFSPAQLRLIKQGWGV